MKRKGLEALSSGTSVVISSPLIQTYGPNIDGSSSFSNIISASSPTSGRTWDETRDTVDKILLQFEGPNASNDIAILKENSSILENLRDNVDNLKLKSNEIKDQIEIQTKIASQQLEDEAESLRLQQERLDSIQKEVDKVQSDTKELTRKEKELKIKIDQYKDQASQEVENIDEVEEEKKAEVYRLQQHISLLALVSGIKWDYDRVDSIAGEVEIPSKGKHVRFEIDREEHSDFEIANMLWNKIGAESVLSM